jgi:hypothetical protein
MSSNKMGMEPKVSFILELAIQQGVRRGYSLAHKHVINPSADTVTDAIEDAVMSSIHDYFEFTNNEET